MPSDFRVGMYGALWNKQVIKRTFNDLLLDLNKMLILLSFDLGEKPLDVIQSEGFGGFQGGP